MKMDAVKGRVTAEGHSSAGANGGIWRTTNFLTNDPNTVEISRVSLGGRTVDSNDPMPVRKAAQLFEEARSRRNGNLQIAQLYAVGDPGFDAQGRLLVGTESGLWRSGSGPINSHHTGALRNVSNHNTSRPGVGVLKSADGGRTWSTGGVGTRQVPVVEIIVCDRGSMHGRVFRLENVTVAPTGGGATASLSLNFQKVSFQSNGMGSANE
jgi:hypothetical protein